MPTLPQRTLSLLVRLTQEVLGESGRIFLQFSEIALQNTSGLGCQALDAPTWEHFQPPNHDGMMMTVM